MAYIKIFPIKVTDKKALDYITNPDKTDESAGFQLWLLTGTDDLEFARHQRNCKKGRNG